MNANGPDRSTWQTVAGDLRARIERGDWQDGDRLPGMRVLSDEYGVTVRTVSRALHEMSVEGYVTALPRAGWLVRGVRPVIRSTRHRLSRAEREAGRGAFTTDCHAAGVQPNVSTDVRIEPAPGHIAAALGVDDGEPVCVRDRVMRGGTEVLQLATSYLPRDLTAETEMEAEYAGPGGIYRRLEDAGHRLTEFTERVRIGRASEHEAQQMRITVGDTVFRVTRTAWSGDRPVEVNEITITGNRYELFYELPSE